MVRYSPEDQKRLIQDYKALIFDVREALQGLVIEGSRSDLEPVKNHLVYGAGRRLLIISRVVDRIFEHLPPDAVKPISPDRVDDLIIGIHAFFINLFGFFDNLAWAFAFRWSLYPSRLNKMQVGMFRDEMKPYLHPPIVEFLNNQLYKDWNSDYLSDFRHALAHRIPPFIPPAILDESAGKEHRELFELKQEALRREDIQLYDYLTLKEQDIGIPGFIFMHSTLEPEISNQILIHPQVIGDLKLICEFSKIFLENWQNPIETN